MIMIPVDEADAFDRLAIAGVKDDRQLSLKLYQAICKEITHAAAETITTSTLYADLVSANLRTFEWVEKAKRNECSAQDVDRANYQRYLAKKALQEKFFPKSP